MLEETESLIDTDNNVNKNDNDNENKNEQDKRDERDERDENKIKKGFISTMKYYLKIPTLCDWIMTGLFICGVIVTIILVI